MELHERSDWRATTPDKHRLFSIPKLLSISVHVYCKPIHTQLFGVQLHVYMTTKLKYMQLTLYYTQNNHFTPNDTLFYRNKFGYSVATIQTLQCLLISLDAIDRCMLIIKLIRNTTALLDKLSKYMYTQALVHCNQFAVSSWKINIH